VRLLRIRQQAPNLLSHIKRPCQSIWQRQFHWRSILSGVFIGVQLPFSSLRVFAAPLEYFTPAYAYAGAPFIPLWIIAIWAALALKCPPTYVSTLIGCMMLTMVLVLSLFCFKAPRDRTWREIPEFLDHRRIKVTTKKWDLVGNAHGIKLAACWGCIEGLEEA